MKSTVPVGTGEKVTADLAALGATTIAYASNPEFLREGAAIQDFLEPDRIVIGASTTADGDASRSCTAASTPTSCARLCRPRR